MMLDYVLAAIVMVSLLIHFTHVLWRTNRPGKAHRVVRARAR